MNCLTDLDIAALGGRLVESGFPASHAGSLLRGLYRGNGRIDYALLNVGPRVEAWVKSTFAAPGSVVRARVRSNDGTIKLLVGYRDGAAVESVLMPGYRPDRAAGCVSSQIGCAMGCDFCASARRGLLRNLEAGEIVEQFLHLKREARQLSRRLTSLVFMGMGEPMHNLENVIEAIRRIADPKMGALGWRQVTVSTVGIVPGIERLAEADLNVNLALSLHAPDDQTRARLVPANRRYPVAAMMESVRLFAARTGRVPTIEYCMLAGVNDSQWHARELAHVMSGLRAHVNLIPYNPAGPGLSGAIYQRASSERMETFLAILRGNGVVAHFRDTRGADVNAACGQLREMAGAAL